MDFSPEINRKNNNELSLSESISSFFCEFQQRAYDKPMWYIELHNYAEWYYTKYFPSKRFLLDKLERKCEDGEIVKKVMESLDSLIVEEKNIQSRVHEYIWQGKTAQYIRTKLLVKKFDKILIQLALEEEKDVLKDPENYRSQIEQAIRRWEQKWVSKKILTYALCTKYSESKGIIDEMLSDYDDTSILQKKAPELLKKYSQEQVTAKLCQKGFSFSDIYTVLRRR